MNIAVINETSAADRNADILAALEGFGHTVINVGMKKNGEKPELTYIHTGLLAALIINTGAADLVVGGCDTVNLIADYGTPLDLFDETARFFQPRVFNLPIVGVFRRP